MTLLKYWDGAAYQPLLSLGAGGTPSRSWYPPRPQPGSVTDQGAATIADVNAPGSGVYWTPHLVPRQTFEATTDNWIISGLWGGYGASDTVTYGATVRARDTVRVGESGYPVLCHAAYWVPLFNVATIRAQAGGEYNGFAYEVHLVSGSNLHSGGTAVWLQAAV